MQLINRYFFPIQVFGTNLMVTVARETIINCYFFLLQVFGTNVMVTVDKETIINSYFFLLQVFGTNVMVTVAKSFEAPIKCQYYIKCKTDTIIFNCTKLWTW